MDDRTSRRTFLQRAIAAAAALVAIPLVAKAAEKKPSTERRFKWAVPELRGAIRMEGGEYFVSYDFAEGADHGIAIVWHRHPETGRCSVVGEYNADRLDHGGIGFRMPMKTVSSQWRGVTYSLED